MKLPQFSEKSLMKFILIFLLVSAIGWGTYGLFLREKRLEVLRMVVQTCGPLDGSDAWPLAIPAESNFCASPLFDGIGFEEECASDKVASAKKRASSALHRDLLQPYGAWHLINRLKAFEPVDWDCCHADIRKQCLSRPSKEMTQMWKEFMSPGSGIEAFDDLFLKLEPTFQGLISTAETRLHAQFTPAPRDRAWLRDFSISTFPSWLPACIANLVRLKSIRSLESGKPQEILRLIPVMFRLREAAAQEGLNNGVENSGQTLEQICGLVLQGLEHRYWSNENLAFFIGELQKIDIQAESVTAIKTQALRWAWFAKDSMSGYRWLELPVEGREYDRDQTDDLRRLLVEELVPLEKNGFRGYLMASGEHPIDGMGRWMAYPYMLKELMISVCSVASYKQTHGLFPQDLGSALKSVPEDLDGKEIRYSMASDGVRIWSVGLDMKSENLGLGPNFPDRDAKDWAFFLPLN